MDHGRPSEKSEIHIEVPLPGQCAITTLTRTTTVAAGVYAPGHLGELTPYVPFELVEAVLAETGRLQRRLRALPSRVGVHFVLAMTLFPELSYRGVRQQLTAALGPLAPRVSENALRHLRRRLTPAPFKALFDTLAVPLAPPHTPGVCYRHWALSTLVKIAGSRWTVEETFQSSRTLAGLDGHQVRRWDSWHRWVTLALLAHAFLSVTAALERRSHAPADDGTSPAGLIPLTCNEIQRLLTLLVRPASDVAHRLRWSTWRRRHQARARHSHYRRQAALQT